ncbi:MAG TPA: DUF4129 domain-containing protein [Actinopolymorphaceae bacterium]|nr:DUF4129 domain-containing protein [Actinopolymorphaceae bacterium]
MREQWRRRIGGVSPSATVATVISVATVVFLLAAGALGLGWQGQVSLADEQLSGDALIMVLAALLGAGLCFAVLSLFLARGKSPARRKKPAGPAAMVLQLVFLALWLFVIWKLRDHLFGASHGAHPGAAPTASPGSPASPPPVGRAPITATWSWPVALAAGFVIALVAATIAMVARRSTATTAETDDDELLDAEDLQQVVAAGRAALAEVDEPRAAVIRSYSAMETALGELGTPRGAADTPTDLLRRAGRAGVFGSRGTEAANELAQLFQQARFSRRDVPPDARYRAVDALNRIEADLRAAVAAQRASAGSTTGAGAGAGGVE